MYSITLGTEHDVLTVLNILKAYTETLRTVYLGWKFLIGNKDDIDLLRRRSDFYYIDPVRDGNKTEHIGTVKYSIETLER